jgi:hypothetical protein
LRRAVSLALIPCITRYHAVKRKNGEYSRSISGGCACTMQTFARTTIGETRRRIQDRHLAAI